MNNKIDAFFVGFALLLFWILFIYVTPSSWSRNVCWALGSWYIGVLIAKLCLRIAYGTKDQLIDEQQEMMSEMLDHMRRLARICYHQQAKIDSLMLEYCPEDMTKEQLANWAANQKEISPELKKLINEALH